MTDSPGTPPPLTDHDAYWRDRRTRAEASARDASERGQAARDYLATLPRAVDGTLPPALTDTLQALRRTLTDWAATCAVLEVEAGRWASQADDALAELDARRTPADLRAALTQVGDDVMAAGVGTVIDLDRRTATRDPAAPAHNPRDSQCAARLAADAIDPAARCTTCRDTDAR